MKRNITTLLFSLFIIAGLHSQIVITEISYNPPESGSDSLEYIEIYNNSDVMVDLTGWSFTSGVTFTFPAMALQPGEYMVSGVNAGALNNVFGITAMQWESGALSNGGETIRLSDNNSNVIDEVAYDDVDDWPTSDQGTDGEGSSIELCDPNSDNSIGTSWRAADNGTGVTINGNEVKGTPGSANTVSCSVEPDHIVSASGLDFTPKDLTINVGETVRWRNDGGLHNVNGDQAVYPNNPESFSNGPASSDAWTFDFTFNTAGSYDYQCDVHVGAGMVGTVTVQEEMMPPPNLVISEILYDDPGSPDSLEFIEVRNNESSAVDMTGFYFNGVDFTFPSFTLNSGDFVVVANDPDAIQKYFGAQAFQFTGGLSDAGELIELYNADNALVDMVSYSNSGMWPMEAAGMGSSITLCNYNADNNDPSNWKAAATAGLSSYMGSELFGNPGTDSYCAYTIGEASAIDGNGASLLDGSSATLQGIVYGINYRPGGLQFAIIDGNNDGISLFSNSEDFGYTVVEGDELRVSGTIDQFNGLTQIVPDQLTVVSNGNSLFDPTDVAALGEDTESQLVRLSNVSLVKDLCNYNLAVKASYNKQGK